MSRRWHKPSDRDLVAFADGSLPADDQARVERAVAASPELQASVAAQRRALAALTDSAGEAPHSLRARIALARDPRPRRRLPALALATFGTGALTVTGVVVVAVLAFGGGGVGAPTVADAAILGTRPPLASIPEPRHESVTLPRVRAAGLPYPYWEDRFGFKAVGFRRDRLGARFATTVFYARTGERIAYTIVSGPRLAVGSAMSRTLSYRAGLRSFNARGRRIVTWLRSGHTCLLSGTTAPRAALLRLAAWRGGGHTPH